MSHIYQSIVSFFERNKLWGVLIMLLGFSLFVGSFWLEDAARFGIMVTASSGVFAWGVKLFFAARGYQIPKEGVDDDH